VGLLEVVVGAVAAGVKESPVDVAVLASQEELPWLAVKPFR